MPHADVKGANALYFLDGKELGVVPRVIGKLSDLGCTEPQRADARKVKGSEVGTYLYRAPELTEATGGPSFDESIDAWAFGLLIFEIGSGVTLVSLHRDAPHQQFLNHLFEITIPEFTSRLRRQLGARGLELMLQLLQRNRADRSSVKAASDHAYFHPQRLTLARSATGSSKLRGYRSEYAIAIGDVTLETLFAWHTHTHTL